MNIDTSSRIRQKVVFYQSVSNVLKRLCSLNLQLELHLFYNNRLNVHPAVPGHECTPLKISHYTRIFNSLPRLMLFSRIT